MDIKLGLLELGVVVCVLFALGFVSCSLLVLAMLSTQWVSVTATYLEKVGFLYRSFTADRRRGRR